ncbi:DNA mismatch repair protein MutL [Pandoraea terrae]|uniref:DNA mismatch repair protein MutL n=1 Tax=Pandoraea terrae TaxID=1537710 RepID=A0A5E4THM2_9BURK|nr:ATP-binding protein [Pandoraea terrae]VVD86762.1 DNA mismatch repair protein MutL [Pandoraea terrae]
MNTLEVVPDPVSLMESMRAVGYSADSAIADLVDNSISAGAERIDIEYDASDDPFVAILDDGVGMMPDELTDAMRHGSRNPTDERDPSDLGRFGLGLKTASLSQCRSLTVISKVHKTISARRWDLDIVQHYGRWLVVVPEDAELKKLPMFRCLMELDSGTLVIWQSLDKLTAGALDPQQEMTIKLSLLREHLALVFHRFTQNEAGFNPIRISVNGLRLPPRDPFLKSNMFRQPLEGQTIRHERGDVHVTPYILPPVRNLTADEIELSGGNEGLRGTQGFYVYRNRRLVIWGTWFKLVPKEEFFKLTRVQVDIPNSFDDLWALDIKKSVAYPPDIIRTRLRELIPHFANTSKRTLTYPGRKRDTKDFVPLWTRVEPCHGAFRYGVNVDHPAIEALSSKLDMDDQKSLFALLGLFGDALPMEAIYADMCADHRKSDSAQLIATLIDHATNLLDITGLDVEQILTIDPLVRYPQYHEKLREELKK